MPCGPPSIDTSSRVGRRPDARDPEAEILRRHPAAKPGFHRPSAGPAGGRRLAARGQGEGAGPGEASARRTTAGAGRDAERPAAVGDGSPLAPRPTPLDEAGAAGPAAEPRAGEG